MIALPMVSALRIFARVLVVVLAILAPTALVYRSVMDIATPYPVRVHAARTTAEVPALHDTVYVGVISRLPSSVIYRGYQPVMDYLTATTGHYFALRLGGSYEETVQQLVTGRVAAAFLGAFLYVKARDEFGVVCVVQPLNDDGTARFRSVLITREGNNIHTVRDLAGHRVAVPPELSYSANWLLTRAMPAAGLDSLALGAVRHLSNHHAVVYEVLRGNADAGVVKDRVAREFRGRGVRVVATSDPIPGAPIVVAAKHDPRLAADIARALLALNPRDAAFAQITRDWDAEFAHGFVVARDADYDVLRAQLRQKQGR